MSKSMPITDLDASRTTEKQKAVQMSLMRLQKYLSAAGVCSRRKGEAYIRAGRIRVNGEVTTQLGTQVDPEKDRIEVDDQVVYLDGNLIYIALNKPRNVVTSCRHPGKKIVLDLVSIPRRVYPVGRLDQDSKGLLLLTNDGRIHHRLSHPSFDHEKEYKVTVEKPIANHDLARLEKGVFLKGTKTRPAKIRRLSSRQFKIILKEGKNRQIRRMIQKVGNQVVELERIRIAHIRLGNLPPGSWRYLNSQEIKALVAGLDGT